MFNPAKNNNPNPATPFQLRRSADLRFWYPHVRIILFVEKGVKFVRVLLRKMTRTNSSGLNAVFHTSFKFCGWGPGRPVRRGVRAIPPRASSSIRSPHLFCQLHFSDLPPRPEKKIWGPVAKAKACNICITPQAAYRRCSGAVHVTRLRTYSL